ncbi:MAG TPA: hypothetical protein VIL86_16125 [Tepidisphaeraceae bacterium]
MKFRIVGSNRISGEDKEFLLDVPDADVARKAANAQGILVADCVVVADDRAEQTRSKVCPYCAETIKVEAVKYRFWRQMLEASPNNRKRHSSETVSDGQVAAGTGSDYQNHDVLNWSFTSRPEPAIGALLVWLGVGLRRFRTRSV